MKKVLFSSLFLGSLLLAQEAINADLTTETAQNTSAESAQDKKPSAPETLEIKKSSKSGVLLGIEAGIGWGIGKSKGYYDNYVTGNQYDPNVYSFYNSKSSYNKMNLFVGYQKYFGEKEILGFDIRVKGGIGLLSNLSLHQKSYYENGNIEGRDPDLDAIFLYTPFSAGIEANFLYDFFQKNNHTLGMSAGLGYDFVYGVNLYTNIIEPENLHLLQNRNLILSILSPKLGLHYYYKHHQFGLKLSFDKPLGKNVASVKETDDNNSNFESIFNFFITTSLSYTYRF